MLVLAFGLWSCGASDRAPDVVMLDTAGPPPPRIDVDPTDDTPRHAETSLPPRNAEPIRFRPWSTDVEEEARRKHQPLLVYVRADWAAACARIERDTFTHADVRFAASAFLPVMIDVTEESTTANELVSRMGVDKMPCVKVVRVVGPAATPTLDVGECLAPTFLPPQLAVELESLAAER